jgi:crotonobetainyl-CoA:carnitine CoA-transferase CaiB-like acyl-CoA transferase
LGREDLIPYQYATGNEKERVVAQMTEIFKTKTKEEWFLLLSPKDIPITPVNNLDEVFSNPHVLHRRMVEEIYHPKLGKVKQVGIPTKFSRTPGKIRRTAPLPGQHTCEILKDLGYSQSKINSLKKIAAIA